MPVPFKTFDSSKGFRTRNRWPRVLFANKEDAPVFNPQKPDAIEETTVECLRVAIVDERLGKSVDPV